MAHDENPNHIPLDREGAARDLSQNADDFHEKRRRDLRVLAQVGFNTVSFLTALGPEATMLSNESRETPPATKFEPPTNYRDTNTTPGRTAEEDAADPALGWLEDEDGRILGGIPADERAATLNSLAAENRAETQPLSETDDLAGGAFSPRASEQYGAMQIRADQEATGYINRVLSERLPEVLTAGEESPDIDWARLRWMYDGDVLILMDPLDGSIPYSVTGQNWAVVLMRYEKIDGTLTATGVTISTPNGKVFSGDLVDRTATVTTVTTIAADDDSSLFGSLRSSVVTEELHDVSRPRPVSDRWTLATVALKGSARKRVAELFRTGRGGWGLPPIPSADGNDTQDPPFFVNVFGGNPALVEMAEGGVRYVVLSDWQTVYDAAGLLMLALQPGRFNYWRLDNPGNDFHPKPVSMTEDEVIALFHDVHAPNLAGGKVHGAGTFRPIPPMLVTEADGGAGGDTAYPYPHDPSFSAGETVTERLLDALMYMRQHQHEVAAVTRRTGRGAR